MKPECQHTQAWMLETLEQERLSKDARMVHLSGCDECQHYLTELREVDDGIKALPQPEVPPALEAQVLARVFSPPSRWSWFGNMAFSWRVASLALVPVLALAVGIGVLRHEALAPSLDAKSPHAEGMQARKSSEAALEDAPASLPNSSARQQLDSVGLSALGTSGARERSASNAAARVSKKKAARARAEARPHEEPAAAAPNKRFETLEEMDRRQAMGGLEKPVAKAATKQPPALSDARTEGAPAVAIRVLGADSPDTRRILEGLFHIRGPALARRCPDITQQNGATFHITIDAEGRLLALKPSPKSDWSGKLVECATAEVGRWTFPTSNQPRQAELQVHLPAQDPKTP